MRKAIFAAAVLCPMLIQAQVISPAQPKSAAMTPVLMARLSTPVTPGAFFAAYSGAIPDTPARVSTGVTSPKLIQAQPVVEHGHWQWTSTEIEKHAVVSMVVGPTGVPTQVQVVHSLGANVDRDVVASVSRYHFQPASLNNETVPMKVELTINIRHGVQ